MMMLNVLLLICIAIIHVHVWGNMMEPPSGAKDVQESGRSSPLSQFDK